MALVQRTVQCAPAVSLFLFNLVDPTFLRTAALVRMRRAAPPASLFDSLVLSNNEAHFGRLPSIFANFKVASKRPDVLALKTSALCSSSAAATRPVLARKQQALF